MKPQLILSTNLVITGSRSRHSNRQGMLYHQSHFDRSGCFDYLILSDVPMTLGVRQNNQINWKGSAPAACGLILNHLTALLTAVECLPIWNIPPSLA
jgi:hypothetical protein